MNKFLIMLTGVLGALFIAASLFGGSASAQTGNARLRVLHASPDAPNVDVYLDGAKAIPNLAFGSITDYVTVPSGSHAVKVFPTSANGTGTPVIDVPSLILDGGKDYTVAAAGKVASIAPVVLTDNNAAPAAGKAHIRVVHLSPDAPNVDIYAAGAGVVVPNLAFKAAADYLPLAAGNYDLEVRAAGASTAVLSLPGTKLEAGKVYTAFAVGLAAGQPALSVKLTTDSVSQQPTPTAGQLPTTGGAPGSDGSGPAMWLLVAGIALIGAGIAVPATLARRTVKKD
ncbi:MAG: DUF4397 domain-containing protein [Chloroflexota bacterium]